MVAILSKATIRLLAFRAGQMSEYAATALATRAPSRESLSTLEAMSL
jgi:hypothetical protein